jgi:hypothetical protein
MNNEPGGGRSSETQSHPIDTNNTNDNMICERGTERVVERNSRSMFISVYVKSRGSQTVGRAPRGVVGPLGVHELFA